MNNAAKQQPKTTSTDSLFGMALAQAFTGLAFGADVALGWEAGEMASAIHEDRFQAKAEKRAQAGFELGVKKSLSGVFSGIQQSLAEAEHDMFKPMLAAANSFSPRAFA